MRAETGVGTLPEDEPARSSPSGAQRGPALLLAWSADEPWRVGEVALLAPGNPGPPHVLGRGDPEPGEAATRVRFVRQRPSKNEAGGPLLGARISRVQLRLRAEGADAVRVENVGRLKLLHDGREVSDTLARVGETLVLGAQLVLLVTARPALLPGTAGPFAFGRADGDGLVGESEAAWALRAQIAFVGPRREHVLVTGASGTGKELVARACHAHSPRAARPLVARNAPTIPEGLVDAELFGNARGYPNAGMAERSGLIGEADGSTLFLDELAEVTPALQAHLLRVLDAGEYQRLGESRTRHSDVRLVAATNRPVSALKHDLAARLAFHLEVPDLNARRDDVPLVARHLLQRIALENPDLASRWFHPTPHGLEPRLSPSLVDQLVRRRFTTHVRELQALLWRALSRSSGEVLELRPEEVARAASPSELESGGEAGLHPTHVQQVLDAHNGVLEEAWRALGLSSRHVLSRFIAKHGLEVRRRARREAQSE